MSTPLLVTKLHVPSQRRRGVSRPRLADRLTNGLGGKLTLVSAPAGSGKSTAIGEWAGRLDLPVAWLSLDAEDNDPARFLTGMIAALQTISPDLGRSIVHQLQSPQHPPTQAMLTTLLNELSTLSFQATLVLDDFHLIESQPVEAALAWLLEHLPPQLHLVIATREDPQLPLARLRSQGQLTELRAADLRFTSGETVAFLNGVMNLHLPAADIALLEDRTEGWIAGLQLAAISMQGHPDTGSFIRSFSGSHHFVLDYLIEEVLQRQSPQVQEFLLQTSMLDRLCGPLCDAVLGNPEMSGQDMLESIERANLFLVPLDDQRHWYRYHHLFADLLQQRLRHRATSLPLPEVEIAELHQRASQWYEDQHLELPAFHHATAANDFDRAERLIDGNGTPLQFRGASLPVRTWLESLPRTLLDTRPGLWVTYASTLLFGGNHTGTEPALLAAENGLRGLKPDTRTNDLNGRIASMRATLAVIRNDPETIISQSQRALDLLAPDNLTVRTASTWTLGFAYQLQGDRAAASQMHEAVIAAGTADTHSIYQIAATLSLGQLHEANIRLPQAINSYRNVLLLAGDPPHPIACEAYLGLARIAYQQNELERAQEYGEHCLRLTRQMESVDTQISHGIFLARLHLARNDVTGSIACLDEAEVFMREHDFTFRIADLATVRVLVLLRLGKVEAASNLLKQHELPLSQARVALATGDAATALALLSPVRQHAAINDWHDQTLAVTILEALAFQTQGDRETALRRLGEALALAAPGRMIRMFVDEGSSLRPLLVEALAGDIQPVLTRKVLAAFDSGLPPGKQEASRAVSGELIDQLSPREMDVLHLIAQGLSNQEIATQLFLALDTVKGHNQRIFGKLQSRRRSEAVARARELGLL